MAENKFIKHLKGEQTAGSLLEIKNQNTPASFGNMPQGTSDSNVKYSDVRGDVTIVANGTTAWKLNDSALTLAPIVNGDGTDYTSKYEVSGAGLWVNSTYTFPSTGDPNHPVAMIFNPNSKWVLKLCGDNLIVNNGETLELNVIITIGTSNIISKQFTIREQANQFCKELVIDFDESNASMIKASGLATLQLQVLCGTADASARIYNGMTTLTVLQRKVDAAVVSGSFANVEEVMRDGILPSDYFNNAAYIAQITDGDTAYAVFQRDGDDVALAGWAQPIPDQTNNAGKFLTTDGSLMSWAQLTISDVDGLSTELSDLQDQITINKGTMDTHIADTSNPHQVSKTQVGLGNVDNTSDLDKPISTATQTALDGKQDVISDLATIRSGAALGATAVQPADLGDATLSIQKNGTTIDTFTANAKNDKVISIPVPTQASDVNALPDTTKYAASASLTINSSTYVVSLQLKDQDGNNIGTAQTIDLPLESVVVSGSYDSATKEVVLTLQDGSTIRFSVADLVSGLQTEITVNNMLNADLVDDSTSTNKFVSASDKTNWDSKAAGTNRVNGASLSNTSSVFYGTSTTAAATTEKEVSIPSITTLDTGTIIIVQPTETSTVANSTIKLNNFSAYPMRYNNAAITTSTDSVVWNQNYPSIFVFDGTYWVFAGHGLDSNTTYTLNYSVDAGQYTAGSGTYAITRYSILAQKADGTWEKITATNASYSTGTSKSVNTSGFILNQLRYYGTTTGIASGVKVATNVVYQKAASVDMRYSTNCGGTTTWALGDYIYLVGTIGADGLFYLDTTTWWSNALPATNDGKLYIRLGLSLTAAGYTMSFFEDRPILYHDGTGIKEYKVADNKQDVISDLATIRSGASAGATAVQPSDLSNYLALTGGNLIGDTGINGADFILQYSSRFIFIDDSDVNDIIITAKYDDVEGNTYLDFGTSTDDTFGFLADINNTIIRPRNDGEGCLGTPDYHWSEIHTNYINNNILVPTTSGTMALTSDIPTVNNSTITIKQGGVTKGSFTLNQASGDTINLDAGGGGGSVAIDNSTITKNNNDEIQAVATINSNTAVGATNPVYDWVGTLAEYEAQAVATNHPDWVCYITDDTEATAYQAYTQSQCNNLFVQKGHQVIEFQEPNAGNNYTWYRKYADGWVEQGGRATSTTITLPITMADTNYSVSMTQIGTTSAYAAEPSNLTTTGFTYWQYQNTYNAYWQVSGMAA